jgi:hypothetical protein
MKRDLNVRTFAAVHKVRKSRKSLFPLHLKEQLKARCPLPQTGSRGAFYNILSLLKPRDLKKIENSVGLETVDPIIIDNNHET